MNRTLTGITVGMILLATVVAFFLLRTGSTPPIRDPQGNLIEASVACLEKVEIGGME
jgi:hypothetical protein